MESKKINWNIHIEDGPEGAVLKATGIRVRTILELIARGYSIREINIAYPKITHLEVDACIEYHTWLGMAGVKLR